MVLLNLPRVLFVATFLLLWCAAWIGMLLRSRRQESSESTRSDFNTVVGATLTLLGLLIGFTFSMATTRYDLRKSLEEEEANAIGTEYARLDLLPGGAPAGLQNLIRQYADLRIQFYEARYGSKLQTINAETAKVQNQLWVAIATSAKAQPTPLTALASSGMNDVLNAQGYTQAAWWNRIPIAAWSLMFLIAVLSNLLIGYGAHGKKPILSLILPLAVALSFFLIADIDSPRGGIIRVHPQNLQVLDESLKTQLGR
jgi:hypothetical protein